CVDPESDCSLKCARACARCIEAGYWAIGSAHEAVQHDARVQVGSCDCPRVVDAKAVRSLKRGPVPSPAERRNPGQHTCARSVEGGYCAIGSTHEAVSDTTCILVGPRDHSRRVDANGDGSLTCTRTCARSVEGGYRSIGSAHEAVVSTVVRIDVCPSDIPSRIDGDGFGSRC